MNKRQALEFQVQDHLGVIALLQDARARHLLAPFDLSKSQFTVLFLLANNTEKQWTMSELKQHLEMNLPGLSKITNKLVERGYVKLTASKQDARKKFLRLTNKGVKQVEKVLAASSDTVAFTFSEWSDQELEGFNGQLAKLKTWLDEHREILK